MITRVDCKGKAIFIELEGTHSIISTLGMTGWWYPSLQSLTQGGLDAGYYKKVIDTIAAAQAHLRLSIMTVDDKRIDYVDPRNFGNFVIVYQNRFKTIRDSLGFDFLNQSASEIKDAIEGDPFKLVKKTSRVGEFLIDQGVIAGLGNIYRAETMYLAQISPLRTLESLTVDDRQSLLLAAQLVLWTAYLGRGTLAYRVEDLKRFFSDELREKLLRTLLIDQTIASTREGVIQRHLVYGQKQDLMGHDVISSSIGGRNCWWVPEVQK